MKKPNFVELVSDHFNGGSADTATLYDVEKFIRKCYEDWNNPIKELPTTPSPIEELWKKAHEIIANSRMLRLEHCQQEALKEYVTLCLKLKEQQSSTVVAAGEN